MRKRAEQDSLRMASPWISVWMRVSAGVCVCVREREKKKLFLSASLSLKFLKTLDINMNINMDVNVKIIRAQSFQSSQTSTSIRALCEENSKSTLKMT